MTAVIAEQVVVRCFNSSGTPFFAPFGVLYTKSSSGGGGFPPGRAYGYVHYQPATGVVASFNSAGKANSVSHVGTFPRMGVLPNTVLVTGWHVGAGFCTLNSLWATTPPAVLVGDVTCYTAAGVPGVGRSLISYSTG